MVISIRLNKEEEIKAKKLTEVTGLTPSSLVKKALFENDFNTTINKDFFKHIGAISTSTNKLKERYDDEMLIQELEKIERSADALWQNL